MKKVSIVIPVFNTAEYIKECLDSVINQSYTDLEIIVVNDGSSDESKELISEYEKLDSRIQSYNLSVTKGVGYARNFGIEKASGEYLYLLDSDDYLASDTIETLYNHIGDSLMISGVLKTVKKKEDSVQEANRPLKEIKLRKIASHFKKNSSLNKLFKMELIQSLDLKFDEEVNAYTDLSFFLPIINSIKKAPYNGNSVYFKRFRNDPITNPSIMQKTDEEIVKDFLHIFNELMDKYKGEQAVKAFLDRLILNVYRKRIIRLFADKKMVHRYFNLVADSISKVDEKRINNKKIHMKTELKLLINRKEKRYIKAVMAHNHLRNIKRIGKSRNKLYQFFYKTFFIRLPLKKNTVVFESFLGKNYSDSPKYIYEYMVDSRMDYNYVWIFNQPGKKVPGNTKQIKRFSLKYYYYLATSKYWVSNSRLPLFLKKRKDNIYLQTWHGTPLKKLVFDMKDIYSANPKYKKHFYLQSRRWDYLISPNQYSSDIFRRAFKFEKEMLEFGYPRNDILYTKNNKDDILNLKQKMQLPVDKKVILYAPTWRDDEYYGAGKYKFNLKFDLGRLKDSLGDEYVVAIRMHYFIADQIETEGFEDFVYNFSKYDDIAELYLVADILITDYSSVFFDYANLKRPILFYTYDLEKYRDTLRGFYIDMENGLPGPLLKTTDEIIDAVQNIEQVENQYSEKYELFYEQFCDWDDGTASKKVVETVFKNS